MFSSACPAGRFAELPGSPARGEQPSVTSSTAETEVTGIGDGVKGSGVGLRGAVTSALQRHREGRGDHHQEETAEEEPSPTAL